MHADTHHATAWEQALAYAATDSAPPSNLRRGLRNAALLGAIFWTVVIMTCVEVYS
ncbi:hypothetical protein RQ831_18400 [Roseomonas gilardii]|uniref:Uncharacterized protein n=1 Tax=Roseomonas gilardii TaxID=257708 RepID=A0ABU3MJ90_9PROT|nr:hypothetical protein [Roseomonas gilardii]MDT8333028.1 hypothetical protein [Roseomonas gilardii]